MGAGAVGGVAPGDAAQVHRVEQERPDVDIFAATVCRDLLCDHRFCRAGRSPDHGRLTGFDEKGEGRGEFARAERVVRGDGVGFPGPLPVATIALDYVKRGQAAERFVPREGTPEAVPVAPAGGTGPGADAVPAAGPGIADRQGALALPPPETAPAPPETRPPPDAPPGEDDIPPPDEPPPAARARVPGKTPGKAGKTVRRQAPAVPPEPRAEDEAKAAPRPGVAI